MILHNAFYNPKPQPGSLLPFGGDEGFEHRPMQFFWNASPRIGHGDLKRAMDSIGCSNVLRLNDQFSALGHAVARVDNQI